ncbi:4-hydroxyphenylacetate 3-hydroxylase N-terminal domain-containing protein [Intestinimonas butyriciproducens]|uniref:4-hydroxyphenylacetate 3-monooxygenase n=1 Tax=Intestinimonas butyriciproducens TaxID=1297617 RepID=A0A0S2W4I5_9FIRM|nr:4-hydroxyphenylacetate 3-hydroxylase N-terminal domain-containing protein [Intestinimonas butyriciproducens]ALP94278.1 4-hydroxyphenylacetate 3-monooxygenase [Intestinimonas butyriciproducens]
MIRTREEYLKALKAMRPNIYKFGELIEDVTAHPATRKAVEAHARGFDAANTEAEKEIFTTTSSFTGKPIMRHTSMMTSLEEIMANSRLKRTMYRKTGTCTGGFCVGWNAMNVMWAVTSEMDQEYGTDYQERLKQWILHAQETGILVAGALTDAKGDRSLKPSEQPNPDSSLHIVEYREDGVVISGCKAMICGVASSEEIFLLPGSGYKDVDKDYALACVVPRDINGLTIIECRHASDGRDLEEGSFDAPETGVTQAYLLFDRCFVPRDRVFMAGEAKYSGKVITYFTANYRACIGACVAGQGDVMIGAGVLMARANGLSIKPFQDKMINMAVNNETTYAVGVAAMAAGKPHASGPWISDSRLAHTNKIHVATLPYETKRLCQEIGGGIVETGCFPSHKDFTDPKLGALVQKYVKAGKDISAETRARAARLSEWLTLGGGVPGCMHGGGSPDGAKMVVHGTTPYEEFAEYAKKVAGITEEVRDPVKPKK